jgi:SagB-type dehydrogenase family enzyme
MLGLCAIVVKLAPTMSSNDNTKIAWNYHDLTKHSYISVRTNPHFLDFNNQPLPFKIYPTLEPSRMPAEARQSGVAALSAIADAIAPTVQSTAPNIAPPNNAAPTLETLAQLLYLSAGITRSRKYFGGEIYFRAAACTGALYEIELYLVCGDLVGLPAAVYHFAPAEFGLRQLRVGDYRSILIEATGAESAIANTPLTIICTATYWRNAWKYQARTYRHFGWDNGTLLANLLAVATALDFPAKVVCGFVDSNVNRLLNLDSKREVAFSLVALGHNFEATQAAATIPAEIPTLGLETIPLSREEIDYPLMREMHVGSSLESAEEVAAWRNSTRSAEERMNNFSSPAEAVSLRPLSPDEMPRDPIEQVILRRGSSRHFERTSISLPQLSTILDRATRGIPADFLDPMGSQLNDLYIIVNAVDGLQPGAYFFHRDRKQLEFLKPGNFRAEAGYLGLEQQLPADAAVDIFFLADLRPILARFGNRGYRAVQLEAGILGGKLYLAAYAQRLGATGLTFYDDDVTRFFSPHAEGKSAIFLVAIGKSLKRKE